MLRSRIAGLAFAGLFALAGCGDGAGEPPRVWFAEPQDGAVVTGPDVQVVLEASGVEITSADVHEVGTGHHHIFVNTDVTPMTDSIPAGVAGIIHMGDGRAGHLITGLEPGEHRLIAVVADWDHIPIDPPAVDTVFITVTAPEGDGAQD